jgi:hypothetical protein
VYFFAAMAAAVAPAAIAIGDNIGRLVGPAAGAAGCFL